MYIVSYRSKGLMASRNPIRFCSYGCRYTESAVYPSTVRALLEAGASTIINCFEQARKCFR